MVHTDPTKKLSREGNLVPRHLSDHLFLHHYKYLVESSNDAIISINERGIIVFWNHASESTFGYLADEAIGSNIEIIIPEEFRQAHRKGVKRVNDGGEKHVIGGTAELRANRKDGTSLPIELSLSMFMLEGKRYYTGIVRDITERKEGEQALRNSEMRFRSLTETASDAIIVANSSGIIQSWNNAAEQIFGHTKEQAIGQSLEIIIPEKYREGHRKGIARVAGGGKKHVIGNTVELEGLTRNGTSFPIELSLSTYETQGEIFFCGIIRDISARKANELELEKNREHLAQQAERLKKANSQIKAKTEELEKLSAKLAKYLSHQVYNSIFEGERDVKIESYRKKLTVFFSDIQGFTELTDRVESETLTQVLNSYLNEMSIIANEYGGTIDKFIGDAVMIFFGDPSSKGAKEDAKACVKMALAMRAKLRTLHRQWEYLGVDVPLKVRMGINSGFCTVGNFGSEDRMDYTIVGSQVNLAHRLESCAETDQILISHETYLLVRDEIACSPRDDIQAKGFAYPIKTYQVIDLLENMDSDIPNVEKEFEGFNLHMDLAKLKDQEKAKIRESLEQALNLLK